MINNILMTDGLSSVYKLEEAVFPIIKEINKENWEIIGTGFYITHNGVIATARHVLADVIDEKRKKQKHPIFFPHFCEDGRWFVRQITQAILADNGDVALGLPTEFKHNKTGKLLRNKVLTLTTSVAKIGEKLITYAYPKSYTKKNEVHCWSNYYEGKVVKYYPKGRDRVMMPTACYQTSINILPGASGGPVFSPSGHVVGINSTSFDGAQDISYVSCISRLLRLSIPVNDNNCTIEDLSKIGYVSLVRS